jgi:hypothetical protein
MMDKENIDLPEAAGGMFPRLKSYSIDEIMAGV